jgi:predicted transcriptional regulator
MLMKRSVIEIVNEILQLEGNKKTEIMYKTTLTYPQAMRATSAL